MPPPIHGAFEDSSEENMLQHSFFIFLVHIRVAGMLRHVKIEINLGKSVGKKTAPIQEVPGIFLTDTLGMRVMCTPERMERGQRWLHEHTNPEYEATVRMKHGQRQK